MEEKGNFALRDVLPENLESAATVSGGKVKKVYMDVLPRGMFLALVSRDKDADILTYFYDDGTCVKYPELNIILI